MPNLTSNNYKLSKFQPMFCDLQVKTMHWLLGAPVKNARIQKLAVKGNFLAYSNGNKVLMRKLFCLCEVK